MNYSVECITVEGSNDLGSPLKEKQPPRHLNGNINETKAKLAENSSIDENNKGKCPYTEEELSELQQITENYFPSSFDGLNKQQKLQRVIELVGKVFNNQPESLRLLTAGTIFTGDCGRHPDQVPEWLDREKFARGQKFARDNLFGLFFAQLLALYLLFSFDEGLKPMIFTGKSSDPYNAFKRYLSTGCRIRNWYSSDPWIKGSPAYNDIQKVRRMHAIVRNKIDSSTNEELKKATTITETWSSTTDMLLDDFRRACPVASMDQALYAVPMMQNKPPIGLNQGEMSGTQCAFICLVILFPDKFGVHPVCDDDLDAFCHVWRGLGYLLGIEDEFNFCQGTLEDVKKRSYDYLNTLVKPNFRDLHPEWEHLMRCVIAGVQYYFPGNTYDVSLLYLTELMELDMPRLRSSLRYSDWIGYYLTKFLMEYPFRIHKIKHFFNDKLNRSIDKALKYDEKMHEKLREKSAKTLETAIKNQETNKSSAKMVKSTQYKFVGLLVLFAQFFIIWRVSYM